MILRNTESTNDFQNSNFKFSKEITLMSGINEVAGINRVGGNFAQNK